MQPRHGLQATLGIAVASTVAMYGASSGLTAARSASAMRSRIAIVNQIADTGLPTLKGRFVLLLNDRVFDSGTSATHPTVGDYRSTDGQLQEPVFGDNVLRSKKGTLTLAFKGTTTRIRNLDPTKSPAYAEYGTWRVMRGTGTYKGGRARDGSRAPVSRT